jgi:hypothetical protein
MLNGFTIQSALSDPGKYYVLKQTPLGIPTQGYFGLLHYGS